MQLQFCYTVTEHLVYAASKESSSLLSIDSVKWNGVPNNPKVLMIHIVYIFPMVNADKEEEVTLCSLPSVLDKSNRRKYGAYTVRINKSYR